MKNVFFALLTLSLLGSCSKKDNDQEQLAANTWTVANLSFYPEKCYENIYVPATEYRFYDAAGHWLSFYFNELPVTGTYKVVDNYLSMTKGSVCVTTLPDYTKPFEHAWGISGNVQFTIADGKGRFNCKEIQMLRVDAAGNHYGYGTLSANVAQF